MAYEEVKDDVIYTTSEEKNTVYPSKHCIGLLLYIVDRETGEATGKEGEEEAMLERFEEKLILVYNR